MQLKAWERGYVVSGLASIYTAQYMYTQSIYTL